MPALPQESALETSTILGGTLSSTASDPWTPVHPREAAAALPRQGAVKAAAGKGSVWGQGQLGDRPVALAHKDQRAGSPGITWPTRAHCPRWGLRGLPGGPTCSGLLGSGGSIGTSGAEASGGSATPSASSSSSPMPPPLGARPSGEEPGRDTRPVSPRSLKALGRGAIPDSASLVGSRQGTIHARYTAVLFGSSYFFSNFPL